MGATFRFTLTIISIVALLPRIKAKTCSEFNLTGLYALVFTPVYKNGTLRLDNINQYAQFLKENDVDGVFVASTAGKGPSLDLDEHKRLLDAWMAAAPPLDLDVISDVGAVSLPDAQEMAAYSEELGVDAILAMPEDYYRAKTPEELVYYLRYIYEAASNTPLLYDHIPQYSDVNVDIEKFFDLATDQIPTFKGVKSDEFKVSVLLQNNLKDDQKIITGDFEPLFAAEVLIGFDSFALASINLFPELVRDIVSNGQNGNLNETRALSQKLNELRGLIFEAGNVFSAMKETMFLTSGIPMGPAKPPQLPLTEEQKSSLEARLRALNITIIGSYADD